MKMLKAFVLFASQAVADEGLNLLQTKAAVHSHATTDPVPWDAEDLGGHCATTRFVEQKVLDTVLKTATKMDFCHGWGDPHFSHVPYDQQDGWEQGRVWAKGVNPHHYQYHENCASTLAKSAPGNPGGPGGRWEIQFSSLGGPEGATMQGVAVKAGVFHLEYWHKTNFNPRAFYVNGELIESPANPNFGVTPVHLPGGFHYWNDGRTVCVLQEGQFLFRTMDNIMALMVPRKVKTEGAGTACYDRRNKNKGPWRPLAPQLGKLMNSAVVVQPGLMKHQTEYWAMCGKNYLEWSKRFKTQSEKCIPHEKPAEEEIPPPDPASACEKSGLALSQAEESCGVLKENHLDFYEDCLIDECMNGSPKNEVEMIEGVMKADEAFDISVMSEEEACEAVPTFTIKDPEYSNLAGQGPDSDQPKGILYPDAAVINGQSVDVLVTSKKFKSFDANKNGAAGGTIALNMKCGKKATVTITIVDKDKIPVSIPAAAVTVLDIDEGKNGKSRTTVSSCGAISASAGEELTSADVPGEAGCKVYSSSKHGTAANNPPSLDAITDDHKKRAVTFLYGAGSTFEFDVAMGKGPKGRGLIFSLSPVLACEEE